MQLLDHDGLTHLVAKTKELVDGQKHDAADITSGAFETERIADGAVTAAKLAPDVGTVAVSDTEPEDENVLVWIKI